MNHFMRKQRIYNAIRRFNKSRAEQYKKMHGQQSALATKNLLFHLLMCKKYQERPQCHVIGKIIKQAAIGQHYYAQVVNYKFKRTKTQPHANHPQQLRVAQAAS